MPVSKDVWVIVEHRQGKLADVTLEMLGDARKLADKLGGEVWAVMLTAGGAGDGTEVMAHHGADQVLLIEHELFDAYMTEPCAQTLAELCREHAPAILLLAATLNGQDLAARLSARLRTGLASDCVTLKVNAEGRLEATRPAYADKVYSTVVCCAGHPQMATLRPGVAGVGKANTSRKAEVLRFQPTISRETIRAHAVGFVPADPKTIDISEADQVVAAGMGVGSREGLQILEELADLIGASLGGSRLAVDQGWLPYERQIGQSGKTVTPRLYIAAGISGASQHTLGMKDAETIIAINTDKTAGIFKLTDLGVVGDLHQVIPALTKKLRQQKKTA